MKSHRFTRLIAVCTTALLSIGLAIVGVAAPASATGQGGGHTPVTLCHAITPDSADGGWNEDRMDANAVLSQGHTEHSFDIIPAFDGFGGFNLSKTFLWGATGQEILDNGCVLPDEPVDEPTMVYPPAASMHDECGTENDRVVVPDDSEGYSFSSDGTDVYLTAAADYVFPAGTETEWHFEFTDEPCYEEPVAVEDVTTPEFTDATCDSDANLVLEDFDNGYWMWSGGSGDWFDGEPENMEYGDEYTVTAVADDGYYIDGQDEWTFTYEEPDCDVWEAEEIEDLTYPEFTDATCDSDAHLLLEDFEHGYWMWSGDGGETEETGESFDGEPENMEYGVEYTVTAVVDDDDYYIDGRDEWTFTYEEPDCDVWEATEVDFAVPTFTDACDPDNDVLTLPESTDEVSYTESSYIDSATGQTIRVATATAEDGFILIDGDALTDEVTWEFAVDDEPCPVIPPVVTPPAVTPPVVAPVIVPVVTPVAPAVAAVQPQTLATAGFNGGELGLLAAVLLLLGVGAAGLGAGRNWGRPPVAAETRRRE